MNMGPKLTCIILKTHKMVWTSIRLHTSQKLRKDVLWSELSLRSKATLSYELRNRSVGILNIDMTVTQFSWKPNFIELTSEQDIECYVNTAYFHTG